MSKADPQRRAVYAAESEFELTAGFDGRMQVRQLRALTADVRRWYGLPPIRLVVLDPDSKDGGWAQWKNGKASIALQPSCRSAHKLLHELAHIISEYYFGKEIEDHGREFCGVAGVLYDAYRVIPKDAYALLLRRHKVKYRPFRFCTARALLPKRP